MVLSMSRPSSVRGLLAGHRPDVLVADDDRDVRETLAELFALIGIDVDVTGDGCEMLEVIADMMDGQAARCDVVVVDIAMPALSGVTVIEELRAIGWREPIVVLSGHLDDALVRARLDRVAGISLVAKPFDPELLLTLVDGLAR
jgi:CheY-like chemotaxis protein